VIFAWQIKNKTSPQQENTYEKNEHNSPPKTENEKYYVDKPSRFFNRWRYTTFLKETPCKINCN
jgi:hypothetical protein